MSTTQTTSKYPAWVKTGYISMIRNVLVNELDKSTLTEESRKKVEAIEKAYPWRDGSTFDIPDQKLDEIRATFETLKKIPQTAKSTTTKKKKSKIPIYILVTLLIILIILIGYRMMKKK